MAKFLPRLVVILMLVGLCSPARGAFAQGLTPATTPYPVDIERIQEAVQRQPSVKLDDHQLRFYVLVLAKEPNFVADFAKNYDFRNGPTKRGAAMTNSEFLNMVTPKQLNELLGSTSASSFAMFQAALMNAGAQAMIKKAMQEIREARNEHEVRVIRERIERDLAALNGGK